MSFALSFDSSRALVVLACFAALGAIDCGGQSQRNTAATGASGVGASGARNGAGGSAPAEGGRLNASGGSGNEVRGGSASGGAASSGAGVGSAGAFTDWTLPHTSDKPWRESLEPLCAPEGSGLPWDLWSDERGIYVLSELAFGEKQLYFNDGTGWSTHRLAQPDSFGLTGFNHGPLVLYSGAPCGVVFQGETEDVCASALPGIGAVFVVDESRTFALAGNRVLRYSGEYFVQYGRPLPEPGPVAPYRLWADEAVVIVPSDQGRVYILSDDNADARVLPLPESAPAHALWAFERDDIWVGLEGGRLAHYDGVSWKLLSLGDFECGVVNALWGMDQVLFFAGSGFVGKVEDGAVELLAGAPRCVPDTTEPHTSEELEFRRIWGNSPAEVFFAVTERAFEWKEIDGSLQANVTDPDACGMQRLYWYDGTRVRPL